MKTHEITVKERFKPMQGTKSLDAKNRLTLSGNLASIYSKHNVSGFSVFVGVDGDILLRPMSTVPAKNLWTKKAIKAVKKGAAEIKAGKSRHVKDLDSFLEQL